jgi:hypothetical protein
MWPTWLEDLVNEFSNNVGDEGWICVSEKRNGSHQRSTVEIYDILQQQNKQSDFWKKMKKMSREADRWRETFKTVNE